MEAKAAARPRDGLVFSKGASVSLGVIPCSGSAEMLIEPQADGGTKSQFTAKQ